MELFSSPLHHRQLFYYFILLLLFRISKTSAAESVGVLLIPAAATATLLGGLFITKLANNRKKAVQSIAAVVTITIPVLFIFLMYCENPVFSEDISDDVWTNSLRSPTLSHIESECYMKDFCSEAKVMEFNIKKYSALKTNNSEYKAF